MSDGSGSTRLTLLLQKAQAGDDEAREVVIEHAAQRLRILAQRMLRSNPLRRWEQTDDLMQQTLTRLHKHLARCPATSTAAFLSHAALEMRHALIDLVRHYFGPQGQGAHHHTATAPSDADSTPRGEPTDPAPTPSQQALLAERWEKLYRAVEALPDDKRAVVELVWFHGLTHAQGAALLGMSERTVGRHWRAARVTLFDELQGEIPGA